MEENKTIAPQTRECWKCGKTIDAQDNYCRYCGAGFGRYFPWYYQFWGILGLILLVGPFALYNIVKSPAINKKTKWVFAALTLLFTFAAVYQIYSFMNIMTRNLNAIMTGDLENITSYF